MSVTHAKVINEVTYPDGPTPGKLQPSDYNDDHIVTGIPDASVIGYWRFNGSAEDSSEHGNDGTLDLGATVTDDILNLDGVDDHCEVPAATEITAAKDAGIVTLVGWFKNEDLAQDNQALFSLYVSSSNRWYIRRSAAGTIRLWVVNAAAGSGASSGNLITDTDWHMYVFVVNSNSVLVYVDGDHKATLSSGTKTLEGVVGSPKLIIGANGDLGSNPWDGKADECQLYDRELSAGEVRVLYASQSRNIGHFNEVIAGSATIGDDADYAEIKPDGEINLHGTARVVSHVAISAGTMREIGGSHGQSDSFTYLNFRSVQDDEAYFTTRVPYRRVADGDLTVQLRWYYTGGNDAGTCEWNLSYHAAKAGEDPTVGGTALTEVATSIATDDTIGITEFTIPGNVLEADDSLGIKLWRDGSDALAVGARLIDVHIHYVKDKLGQPT